VCEGGRVERERKGGRKLRSDVELEVRVERQRRRAATCACA